MTKQYTVADIITISRHWIQEKYGDRADFVGAHLVGSLHHMPRDTVFPSYRDIDLAIVLDSITEQDIDDAEYEGLLLEAILVPKSRYTDVERMLSDACNASIFASVDNILLDPRGELIPIAEQVSAQYSQKKWMLARRDSMLDKARKSLTALTASETPQQIAFALGELNMYLIATLTTAHLTPLTHRRNMLQLSGLISSPREQAAFESLHRLIGSAEFNKARAEQFLDKAVSAFDYAVSVHKTPVPYDHKLAACVRPYLLDGTLEMFAEEGWRESFFWIALFLMISCAAIQADGTPEAQAKYLPYAAEVFAEMKLQTPEDIRNRIIFAQKLMNEIADLSTEIIDDNSL